MKNSKAKSVRREKRFVRSIQHKRFEAKGLRLRSFGYAIFPLVIILLGGGTMVAVQGGIAWAVGLALMVHPPRVTFSRALDRSLLAFFIAGCCAFMPSLLPAQWRDIATSELGIELSSLVTAQPWLTLESLVLMLPGFGWLYLLINWKVDDTAREQLFWLLSISAAVMALAVSLGSFWGYKYPLGSAAACFSFFDNRNQTSITLAMIGVLAFALAMQGMRRGRLSGLIGLMLVLLILVGISFSLSRAGVFLFFGGCFVWFLFRLRSGKVPNLFRIGVPVFIIGLSMLLFLGKDTWERFLLWNQEGGLLRNDMRVSIYWDALDMIRAQPIFGVGLGNFTYVFPQFRERSLVYERIIHPESDWFWIWTEMGTLGLVAWVAVLYCLFSKLFPFYKEKITAAYRAAALVGMLLCLVHSFIDVSGHRFGTLFLAMLLYRLALPPHAYSNVVTLPRFVPRMIGVGCLLVGTWLVLAGGLNIPMHSQVIQSDLNDVSQETMAKWSAAEADARYTQALKYIPMSWRFYGMRAQHRLLKAGDEQSALEDYRRARFLEPVSTPTVYYEGIGWLRYGNYDRAFAAWRELLHRKDPNRQDLFRKMLEQVIAYPEFRENHMSRLTRLDVDFRYNYLMQLKEKWFLQELLKDANSEQGLELFSKEQKSVLFIRWAKSVQARACLRYLKEYPDTIAHAWFYQAMAHASLGQYERAIELAQPHIHAARIPNMSQYGERSIAELERLFVATPGDLIRDTVLVKKQIQAQAWDSALKTLTALATLEKPPPYVHYWQGELHRRNEQYVACWKSWEQYLQWLLKIGS